LTAFSLSLINNKIDRRESLFHSLKEENK